MILVVLIIALFSVFFLIGKFRTGWDLKTVGSLTMGVLLIITGFSHFIYTDGMVLMLPHIVPMKTAVIYATGIFEIVAGIGLIMPKYRRSTALILMVFLIVILPANFKAAYDHLDLTTGTYDGPGPGYLWFRVPLQIGLILWVWHFSFKNKEANQELPA